MLSCRICNAGVWRGWRSVLDLAPEDCGEGCFLEVRDIGGSFIAFDFAMYGS